jgi:hypothetical protein
MPVLVESIGQKQSVNDLLRDVIINSFGILTGLQFRELLIAASLYFSPGTSRGGLIFNLFVALLIFLITVVLVIIW